MIVLIPLGGTGERFKQNGYKTPKALINLFGKPMLYYLIDNLNTQNIDFIYIAYNEEYYYYRLENILTKKYPDIKFKFLRLYQNTRGAAETINLALQNLTNYEDKPILCLDSDNFYTTDIIKLWNGENKLITFKNYENSNIYSYVKLENDIIVDIIEKNKISDHACCGAYGFSSYKDLQKYTQYVLDNNIKEKNEFYTSVVIKQMLKDNILFKNCEISFKNWHCLGTPLQLKIFYNNYPKISSFDNLQKISNLRICFDLDNTLVTYPKIENDYTSVEPIIKNVNFLKYLKKMGNTIIIYTARKMKTHNGNIGKSLCDIGKITFETLYNFDIPFDEIYFGKPYADFYIDDLAVNCYDDMEKLLGFYNDTISTREYNDIIENTIQIFKKMSNDLSGEIYYYNNIPPEIKDMFPLLIDYDDINKKWYKVEKINGISFTNMFLSELLTSDNLLNIMNSIKRIQNVFVDYEKIDINIYANYCDKLKDRYNNFDYSCFPDSEQLYNELYSSLENYEKNKLGKLSVIHGDAVMTNILINNFGKIKFIDMRGKIGDRLSIYGDYLYDFGKLYQSLIGYDKILQCKQISKSYEEEMIKTFEEYFIKLFSYESLQNLKIITKSLLFTLIPLHNNEKCKEYYDLIKRI
jgi:capsule biosynthesis phosphatase